MAIANAFDNNFAEAVKLAEDSAHIQQNVGYRGGVLFANLALGIAYALAQDQTSLEPQIEKVLSILSELAGEKFSILPLMVTSHRLIDIQELRNKCQWLDFDRTLQHLQDLLPKKS